MAIDPLSRITLAVVLGSALSMIPVDRAAAAAAAPAPVVSGALDAFLPPNKTVVSATPAELARAVRRLVQSHPLSPKQEQSALLAQLKALDCQQAQALVAAMPQAAPPGEVPALTRTLIEAWTGIDAQKIASLAAKELARQVKAAVQAYPCLVDLITRDIFSQFTVKDGAKATAVVSALVEVVPPAELAAVIRAAIEALPSTVDAATGLSVRSALGQLVAQQAVSLVPGLAAALGNTVGALTSESGGATTSPFAGSSGGFAPTFQGPAGIVNPANFSNTSGTILSPSG